jgi:hypothetical protein
VDSVSDIAHEMLRMFGLSMGIDVKSNQRLAKIREIREQEMEEIAEGKPRAKEPTVLLQRRPSTTGSTHWIPPKPRA